MTRVLDLAVLISAALFATPQSAMAQEKNKLRLPETLYFDCEVSPEGGTDKAEFDVSYLVYADHTPSPQVNFFDPTKIMVDRTGWAPMGHFALSRLTSGGRLFVWRGEPGKAQRPQINAALEMAPVAGAATRATISLVHFRSDGEGNISAHEFAGDCERLTGEPAYNRYSGERAQ